MDRRLEDGIGLTDQLHIAVFDAVMDHFHIMSGAIGPHVSAAGLTLGDGGDFGVDRCNGPPTFLRTAGHDGRSLEGALFTA